ATTPRAASNFVSASFPGVPSPQANEPRMRIAPAAQRWLPPTSHTFHPWCVAAKMSTASPVNSVAAASFRVSDMDSPSFLRIRSPQGLRATIGARAYPSNGFAAAASTSDARRRVPVQNVLDVENARHSPDTSLEDVRVVFGA